MQEPFTGIQREQSERMYVSIQKQVRRYIRPCAMETQVCDF